LLQLNKLSSNQHSDSLLNGLGATFIMISLVFDFNLSAFVIESFWLLISLVGIADYYRSKYRSKNSALVENKV
jgi:hypothetical protein